MKKTHIITKNTMYGDNMTKKAQEKHAGQWVVIVDKKIVWHNKYPKGMRNQVIKYNEQNITPLVFRVSDGTWPLG